MAVPAHTDDAPTTPIARADLQRAARGRRGLVTGAAVAATVALLVVAGVALGAAGRSGQSTPAAASPTAATAPAGPNAPAAAPEVPVGGVLFQFTGSANDHAHLSADGDVVAVLDDTPVGYGRGAPQIVTYDQRTGAQLATTGPGLPEILDCGVTVVRRPDGTSVVLSRYDTEVPAQGVQLGRREAHVAARDARTLRPLWDVVLHSGDTTDQTLLVDTVCHSQTPAFFPTADGRFVLNRSFDVSRLIDLGTGAMRPIPFAVNVAGNSVVAAVPDPVDPAGGQPPDPTGPSSYGAVRLVADTDLSLQSTISDKTLVKALTNVGPPGRPTLDGFISSGSDTRYTLEALSGDAHTIAVRDKGRIALVDLPSGRVRTSIPLPPESGTNDSSDLLTVVPGDTSGQDVVVVGLRVEPASGFVINSNAFTGYDLSGRRLWSLPTGAADLICAADRGILLLKAAGLTSLDPVSGRQLSVEQNAECPSLVAGLAVSSTQGSAASSSATYTVRVLHRS